MDKVPPCQFTACLLDKILSVFVGVLHWYNGHLDKKVLDGIPLRLFSVYHLLWAYSEFTICNERILSLLYIVTWLNESLGVNYMSALLSLDSFLKTEQAIVG